MYISQKDPVQRKAKLVDISVELPPFVWLF